MKKEVIGFLISIFSISLVSADSYGGAGFSLSEFLYSINVADWILYFVWIVSFSLIWFALNRTPIRDNKTVAGILSMALATGITVAVNLSGLDLSNILFGIGITESTIYTVVPVVLLISLLILGWRFGFLTIMGLFGLILIFLGAFTDFFYESATVILIGAIILTLVIIIWFFKHRRSRRR